MVKILTQQEAVNIALDYLRRLQHEGLSIEGAYLYGSYAKGTARDWSDIDLAVLSSKFVNRPAAHRYLWRRLTQDEIIKGLEPVGLCPDEFDEESPLAYRIKREGIELKV